MLHALALVDEEAVDDVDGPVGPLDDGRVMIAARRLAFQMPGAWLCWP